MAETEVAHHQEQQDNSTAAQNSLKTYLEQNPDALQPLFRSVCSLYLDPQKESLTK